MIKVHEVRGTFEEVYSAAQNVFDSLPPALLVKEALVNGHLGPLQDWYVEALRLEYRPGSSNQDAVRLDLIDNSILLWTPTSGRLVTASYEMGVLSALVNFGTEGSAIAAGYIIRQIKYHHPVAAASYTTVDGITYQVAHVTPEIGDILYCRKNNGPEENSQFHNASAIFSPEWPAIVDHRTKDDYNKGYFHFVIRKKGHEEEVQKILAGEYPFEE